VFILQFCKLEYKWDVKCERSERCLNGQSNGLRLRVDGLLQLELDFGDDRHVSDTSPFIFACRVCAVAVLLLSRLALISLYTR
jgi:hypothetical protein